MADDDKDKHPVENPVEEKDTPYNPIPPDERPIYRDDQKKDEAEKK